jgi:hypothetical protein
MCVPRRQMCCDPLAAELAIVRDPLQPRFGGAFFLRGVGQPWGSGPTEGTVNATNLDQPADVLWLPVTDASVRGIVGGEQKHFASLRAAILFIMETLPPRDRATAWITLQSGSLQIEEIEKLYGELDRQEGN